MKKNLSFLLFLCLLLSSCQKRLDTHVLPPETQTGRGYLAFKANGDICVLNPSFVFPYGTTNYASFSGTHGSRDTLRIIAKGKTNLSSERLSFEIYVIQPEANKELSIAAAGLSGVDLMDKIYYRSEEGSGKIFFTSFDLEKKVVSGRFSVNLFNEENKNQKKQLPKGVLI